MIPAVGLAGCLLLAFLLPVTSVLVGAGVVLLGALVYCGATVAVGLDRRRQGHEDAVLTDLVDQPGGLELVAQILLDPGHREHYSAAFQFGPQLVERVERGEVDLHVRLGVEHEPLDRVPRFVVDRRQCPARKSSALAKNNGAS